MAADSKNEEERRKMRPTLLNSTREMKVKSSYSNDDLRKKVKFNNAFNIDIPQDILLQIFCKLPVKSLIRFSCLSKLWFYLIIKDQQFSKFYMVESKKKPIIIFTFKDCEAKRWYCLEKQHLNIYGHQLLVYGKHKYMNHQYMIGYSNGLACYPNFLSTKDNDWTYLSLQICNPSRIEKLIFVSRLKRKWWVGGYICGYRFGYDPLSDEYKVMCIMEYVDKYEYYIITLGSRNPWRKINNPWPKQRPMDYFISTNGRSIPPISCNGTLFYEMIKDEVEEKREKHKNINLVSLDLHREKFQITILPDDDEFISNYNNGDVYPLEYKGCFCYSSMKKVDPYSGKVMLHILKDTLKHVWDMETFKFDLTRGLHNRARLFRTCIVSLSNQVIIYWRFHNKENGQVTIRFFNVHSKESKEAEQPYENSKYDYYTFSHVENSLSLETLATTNVDGNTREVLKKYRMIGYLTPKLFNCIPTSNPEVISFVDPF